ncbi:hypothetical protein D3C76_1105300 [compost metagenome]
MQVGQGGVRAVAFILAQVHVLVGDRPAELVDHLLAHTDRHDLIGKQPRGLGRRRALLGLQAVGVLGFAADTVALGDDLGSEQHRHVGMLGHAHYAGILLHRCGLHMGGLHQADLLLAGANRHLHAVDHDLLGGNRYRHQPRGALAVDGLAADR